MTIQLVFVSDVSQDDDGDDVINNAPCVPHVGAKIDTCYGLRQVVRLHYDFHPNNGVCRVWVYVTNPQWS
jgi:hypothetical protein